MKATHARLDVHLYLCSTRYVVAASPERFELPTSRVEAGDSSTELRGQREVRVGIEPTFTGLQSVFFPEGRTRLKADKDWPRVGITN